MAELAEELEAGLHPPFPSLTTISIERLLPQREAWCVSDWVVAGGPVPPFKSLRKL